MSSYIKPKSSGAVVRPPIKLNFSANLSKSVAGKNNKQVWSSASPSFATMSVSNLAVYFKHEISRSTAMLSRSMMLYKHLKTYIQKNSETGSYIRNPSKPTITIDSVTTKILSFNDRALELLCENFADDLFGQKLSAFVNISNSLTGSQSLDAAVDSHSGALQYETCSVVSINSNGSSKSQNSEGTQPTEEKLASMNAYAIDDTKSVVTLEPIDFIKTAVYITIPTERDPGGRIVAVDENFLWMSGKKTFADVYGHALHDYLPQLDLNVNPIAQHVTLKSQGLGGALPVTAKVHLTTAEVNSLWMGLDNATDLLRVVLYCFVSLSGLVTVDETGSIRSVNRHFAFFSLGYADVDAIVGSHIDLLLPDFTKNLFRSSNSKTSSDKDSLVVSATTDSIDFDDGIPLPADAMADLEEATRKVPDTFPNDNNSTNEDEKFLIATGRTIKGFARHANGATIPVLLTLDVVEPRGDCGQQLAVWLSIDKGFSEVPSSNGLTPRTSRDFAKQGVLDKSTPNITNMPPKPQIQPSQGNASKASVSPNEKYEMMELDDVSADKKSTPTTARKPPSKDFIDIKSRYHIGHCIGRGAYGMVRLGKVRTLDDTGEMVVIKVIKKVKLPQDMLVPVKMTSLKADGSFDTYSHSLREAETLRRLQHDKIVRMIELMQSEAYFFLILEKHGIGMDLFEFLDNGPSMDEPLIAALFRQIVSGVAFLHSQSICHRDLKDENVIINEHLQCKLIDFGAARPFSNNHVFRSFCGTYEYCSPEVLSGQPYYGPELDLWALGVILFVMAFSELPFAGVEAIIARVRPKPPTWASAALVDLVMWMLAGDARGRPPDAWSVLRHVWLGAAGRPQDYSFDRLLPNWRRFTGNLSNDNRVFSDDEEIANELDASGTKTQLSIVADVAATSCQQLANNVVQTSL